MTESFSQCGKDRQLQPGHQSPDTGHSGPSDATSPTAHHVGLDGRVCGLGELRHWTTDGKSYPETYSAPSTLALCGSKAGPVLDQDRTFHKNRLRTHPDWNLLRTEVTGDLRGFLGHLKTRTHKENKVKYATLDESYQTTRRCLNATIVHINQKWCVTNVYHSTQPSFV